MKTGRAILLFGLLTFCLVALVGCGKKADKDEPHEGLIIEALVGIGPVEFGMSNDEVIKHLGQPDKILGEGRELNYVSSRGLSFTVDTELGMQQIKCWSDNFMTKLPFAVTTFGGRTKESIGMGATQEQIIAAYGQPDRTRTDQKGEFENLYYDELRAKFVLRQSELVAMTLDAPK
ncbi:MAG: hypothetical protein ACYS1A_05840 [Planctomycetota bacterium]|jgi:hypothetical protein